MKPASFFIRRIIVVAILLEAWLSVAFGSVGITVDSVSPGVHSDTLRPLYTSSRPVIDGDLNDPVWKIAPHVTGFATFIPDYGKIPKEQTDVSLAYDKENIYFAFRCYDDPSAIKASVATRDKLSGDDFVCVNLDAFNDQQGGYALYINPRGSQADSRFSPSNEDFSPDFVWYSAGRIDSLGYTVEVQIPFQVRRFQTLIKQKLYTG